MIRRMVEDLDFPLEVLVAPTVREPDGLAMSSRNAYLDPGARAVAPVLSRALDAAHRAFRAGTTDAAAGLAPARALLETQPALRLEYLEAVDPVQLAPVTSTRWWRWQPAWAGLG
jgi:pantoate--beta-alanine ligase